MKNLKKIATARLLAAILLLAVCMAGLRRTGRAKQRRPFQNGRPGGVRQLRRAGRCAAGADAPHSGRDRRGRCGVGTAGSSLLAVQAAVKLLDWGVNTGLDTDEIGTAASVWLSAKNDDRTECLQKLELVDEAYQKLLTDEARELLDSAGCADVEITWGASRSSPWKPSCARRGCGMPTAVMTPRGT